MYICHCVECRAQSASAFGITALFPAFDLVGTATSGGDNIGVYTHQRTISGRSKDCYFCKTCGTRLMHGVPGARFVAVKGCLDELDAALLAGATHIWTKSAVVPIPEGVEAYAEEPPSG